jgi:hypothetical protein
VQHIGRIAASEAGPVNKITCVGTPLAIVRLYSGSPSAKSGIIKILAENAYKDQPSSSSDGLRRKW